MTSNRVRPKLLWHSNAPWAPTGYGNQTGLFAPRLTSRYDLRVSAFYGLEGTSLNWEGVQILPGLGGTFGNETLPAHANRFFDGDLRGGLVVTLMDVWVLNAEICSRLDMACWVPVDHQPAPPAVIEFFRRSQAVPLAMSRFGMDMLQEFDPIYVPHAVDTSVYMPRPRAEARKLLGVGTEDFVVGMVAANKGNPSRKSFVAVLEAFARFHREHENARLYLHTEFSGEWSHGVALGPVIESLGIPADAVGFPDPYVANLHPLSPKAMSLVYSAMDVLACPSTGEGFGIPILEAQSCGVPVVVSDFSAMPEVCGSGWKVSGARSWTGQRSWQLTPSVDDIVAALEEAYSLSNVQREQMAKQARSHALSYDVKRVLADHMLPGLAAAQKRHEARRAMVLPPRANTPSVEVVAA